MRPAISRTRLDLSGAVVVTEAATRAYAVTPILASLLVQLKSMPLPGSLGTDRFRT